VAIKVGFVGCGGMNSAHMKNLSKLPEAELAAFADVNLERAQAKADEFGGKAYASYEEMLEKEDLQAVYVAVPPFAHTTAELLAVEKGCGLFVEKPVALTLEKALEIKAAIEKAGVVNQVGYHWRLYDTTDKVKELLPKEKVGMALGYWMGGFPGVSWWRVMKESGGQFVEQTTHIFDLARYLVGEIKQVAAFAALRGMKDTPNMDVPDVGVSALEFESGAVGCVMNTCELSHGFKVGLTLISRDLVIEHNNGSVSVSTPEGQEKYEASLSPVEREDEIFINAVKTGDTSQIRSSYADAVKTLAVTLAVNESWQSGKEIAVPEV